MCDVYRLPGYKQFIDFTNLSENIEFFYKKNSKILNEFVDSKPYLPCRGMLLSLDDPIVTTLSFRYHLTGLRLVYP